MRHAWDAHTNLQRLYAERIEARGITQKQFGKKLGISQSMVAQILSGDRALPLDLAAGFANELGCTIYDICPDMGDYIRDKLLPVLGKALRRAAVIAALAFLPALSPAPASSGFAASQNTGCVLCKVAEFLEILRRIMGMLLVTLRACLAPVCTISGLLKRCGGPSRRLSAALHSHRSDAPGFSWPISPLSLPRNTLTSSLPYATH